MRITYFGSDLTDPATVRRIHILRTAGADVNIIGFRRSDEPLREIEGVPVVDLGQTHDAKLVSRSFQILLKSMDAGLLRKTIFGSDLLLGRNLEMTTMAHMARVWAGADVPLAYECLDIHRAFLGKSMVSRMLRNWERAILRRSAVLILSSPGFVSNYFRSLNTPLPTVVLAENKRVMVDAFGTRPHGAAERGRPPWRIGWFGKLRCAESFRLLFLLAQRQPDLIDVELRGTPLPDIQKLIDQHLPIRNMRFNGRYSQDDLIDMYSECDFTWNIEYYNRGTNSDWCLANRLYEGGYCNCPSIALAGTETAAWLQAHGTGVLLREPQVELEPWFVNLTTDEYRRLRRTCEDVVTSDLAWTAEECDLFLTKISGAMPTPRVAKLVA